MAFLRRDFERFWGSTLTLGEVGQDTRDFLGCVTLDD